MNNSLNCKFTPETPEDNRSVTILKARKTLGTWSAQYCTASLERVVSVFYGLAGITATAVVRQLLLRLHLCT